MRVPVVLLLLVTLCACAPRAIHFGAENPDRPQLVVHGEGRIKVAPDQMQLQLEVITSGSDADQALSENNQRMTAMMAKLAEIGITGDEMATSQFQIRPEWSLPPRPTPANWQRQIVGYRVSNELLIKTTRIKLAGRLLAVAQQTGANQIGGLRFTLADPEKQRQKAITMATEQAIREAKTLALAAGVRLGQVRSLTLDSAGGTTGPQVVMAAARTASAETVPVVAGKVEVSARVSLVYQLEVEKSPAYR